MAVEPGVDRYWLIRHKLDIIDGVVMKVKSIIIPCLLQKQIPEQLHSNCIGTEKSCILVRESVNWINMNADYDKTVKQCSTCLEYQCTQPQEAVLNHDILCKPWEIVGADVFLVNNNIHLINWPQYGGNDSLSNLNVIYALFQQSGDNFNRDINKDSNLHCHPPLYYRHLQ